MNWDQERVADEHAMIAIAFRRHCQANGYSESERAPLRAKGNPTLRFHNSSISVLMRHCAYEDTQPLFLLQPALRLRNQAYVKQTGRMSPYGCYFIAFGTLCSPNRLSQCFREFETFFLDALKIPASRLVLRVTAEDKDFLQLISESRVQVEIDGCDKRFFRHKFGVDGVSGRNINMAIVSLGQLWDVANLIVLERDGRPWAVEAAFGINNILTRREEMTHPVLATTAAALGYSGKPDLILMDSLSSAVALAMEGFEPRARGREGNYRQFVGRLSRAGLTESSRINEAIWDATMAERKIRDVISKPSARVVDLPHEVAARQLMRHVTQY